MKFRYFVTLKDGFTPVMSETIIDELEFEIKAKNRATADRMVKAMLESSRNIIEYNCVALVEL